MPSRYLCLLQRAVVPYSYSSYSCCELLPIESKALLSGDPTLQKESFATFGCFFYFVFVQSSVMS